MIELLAGNRESVTAHLHSLGWITCDESIEALTPAGVGNMNRTLRAHLPGRTLVLKQSVPYVAKYPEIPAPEGRIAVEAAFYRATARAAVSSALPKVLGFDAGSRLMALEDLGDAADFTDLYVDNGASVGRDFAAQIVALVDWIGLLHELHIDIRQYPELENHSMRALNHAHIFDIPFRAQNASNLDAMTPGLSAIAHNLSTDGEVRKRVMTLGEIYLGKAPHASPAGVVAR